MKVKFLNGLGRIIRLKFKKKKIYYFLLMFSITACWGANYWISSLYTSNFIMITSLVLSLFVVLFNHRINLKSNYWFSTILTIVMWISGIVLALKYALPFSMILQDSCYTIAPLFIYFAYRSLIKNQKDICLVLHFICISAIVCNIVAFIEMYFALRGIDFLNIDVFSKTRNSTPRFIIGEVVLVLGFFISFSNLADKAISNKKKIMHFVNVFFTVVNMIFIIKTRTLSLYILASILIVPIFNKETKKRNKIILGILAICIIVIILMSDFVPFINTYLNSDVGIQMRFYEIEYYLDIFKKNWLFGVGYLSSNKNAVTYNIISGPYERYYTSDVGIVGLMFRSGIVGLFWLFSWFYKTIQIIKNNNHKVPTYYNLLMRLIILFYLLSCINLIFTDTPRISYIALGMLIIESSDFFQRDDICCLDSI